MSTKVMVALLCLCIASGAHAQWPVTDGLIIDLRAEAISGLQDGDPITAWIDSAQEDSVDGTVTDVGAGTPTYKTNVLHGKPVVRFNGAEALSSAQFAIDAAAGVTVAAVFTGDKSGALHERLGHFGAWDASGGVSISMDVCTQQGTNEGSGFRLNNGWSLAGNPNPLDTNFHVGVWQAAQRTPQSGLMYYVDGVRCSLRQNNPNNTVIFPDTGNVVAVGNGHNPGGGFYSGDFVTADLAVLLVYNRVLSDTEVKTLSEYLRQEYLEHKQAVNPTPADDVQMDNTFATLTWEAGKGAVSHRIYLSTDRDEVANASEAALLATSTQVNTIVGLPGGAVPSGLVPGTTYYWRVDEVAADGTVATGSVWSFRVPSVAAYDPVPANGVQGVLPGQVLSWKSGLGALLHTVYIGTDADAVANGADGIPQAVTTYTPQNLQPNTTYYWRVDEFTAKGTTKGAVWSFTTIGDLAVTDASLIGWWTMDQVNAPSVLDMSGHGLHGTVQGQIEWIEGPAGSAAVLTPDDLLTTPVPNVTTDTLTMTAWIQPAKVHGRTGIIFMRSGALTTGINLMPNNQLGYHWLDAAESWQYASGLIAPTGEWSFVALVVTPEKANFYLDDLEVTRELVRRHDPVAFSGRLTLGSDTLDATRRYVGALDDLRFYNRALSPNELKAVMEAGTKPARPATPMSIEDFDAYNAYNGEKGPDVWDVWADGYGGNGTGSTAGNLAEPFMSRDVIVGTGQALPMGYNNTGSFADGQGKLAPKLLSEISRTFSPAQDLTRGGARALTFWFRGNPANTVEASDVLYLGVRDAGGKEAVAVVAQPTSLLKVYWQSGTVELTALTGVDLTRVTQVFLGVGTRAAPQKGGVGTVLIDNLQLSAELGGR